MKIQCPEAVLHLGLRLEFDHSPLRGLLDGSHHQQDGENSIRMVHQSNPGMAAATAILRDDIVNIIKVITKKVGYANSLMAKLWGIWIGLKLALEHCGIPLIIESDSQGIVLLLTSPMAAPSWQVQHLVQHIKDLLRHWRLYSIVYRLREGNQVADAMAAYVLDRQDMANHLEAWFGAHGTVLDVHIFVIIHNSSFLPKKK